MSVIDNVNSIIMLLCKGMSNRKLYFSEHPRVNSYAMDIVSMTGDYFRSTDATELFIGIVNGNFVFEGKRVFGPSVTGKHLLDMAVVLHCGGFILQRGLSSTDLKKFFDITALRKIPVKKIEDSRKLFKNYGINKISIADVYQEAESSVKNNVARPWEGQSVESLGKSPTMLYQELYNVVAGAYGEAAFDKHIDLDKAKSVSEFMLHYVRTSFADVMQHVHYPDFDTYTVGHSVRVASLAVYVGSKIGWQEKDLLALGTAGLLHDIGKSKIPDGILLKKGPLTEEEFAVVREHPQEGVKILLEQNGTTALDIAACWGHHIRYDGGGYPKPPVWAVRHPVTALLQICDVFEALTAIRPYKEPYTPQGAFSIMVSDRGGFHPGLLATFISVVGVYPPGTYVRLSDRRVGMVTEISKKIDRPKVQIISSQSGASLDDYDQYELDLSHTRQQDISVSKLLLDFIE